MSFTDPRCDTCAESIEWREGQGWCHRTADGWVIPPSRDVTGHEATAGAWLAEVDARWSTL